MIRVRKNLVGPTDLATKGYSCDAIRKAILDDQDGKCYLCERSLTTDFQVEHLQSQNNFLEQKDIWNNLFIACGYCNQKKSCNFDDICNPSKCNLEQEISQKVNFATNKAEFSIKVTDEAHQKTETLLRRLYNGTQPRMRNCREERFWNAFVQQINVFQAALNRYIEVGDNEKEIVALLDVKSENLGFKYTMLSENPALLEKFSGNIVWNK